MLFKVATCEMHAKMQSSTAKAKANSVCTLIQAAVSIEQFSTLRIIQKFLEQFFSQWVRTILETKYHAYLDGSFGKEIRCIHM